MKIPVLFAMAALVTGCANKLLVPLDFEPASSNVQAYVDLDSFTVSLENIDINVNHTIFGMEVENKGSSPVHIRWSEMKSYVSNNPFRTKNDATSINENANSQMGTAIYPLTLNQIKIFYKEKVEAAKAAAVFFFLVGATVLIADGIQDINEPSHDDYEKDIEKSIKRDIATDAIVTTTNALSNIVCYSGEKATEELTYLPVELFVKQWIDPGETYRGKIIFPRREFLRYYRIYLPLDKGKELVFDFRKANYVERESLRMSY